MEFLDIAWVTLHDISSADDIPVTMVYCETIELSSQVRADFDSLLQPNRLGREKIVSSFHSITSK